MATGMSAGDEMLQCAICMENMSLRWPRALACLHTFCELCVQGLLTDETYIICPVCRKKTTVKDGKISNLPVNFQLKAYADKTDQLVKSKICESCVGEGKSVVARWNCRECDIVLCDDCSKLHTTLKTFSSHKPVAVYISENNEGNCPTHKKKQTLFCVSCCSSLCVLCVKKHEEHEELVKDIKTGTDEYITSLIEKTEEALKENDARKVKVEDRNDTISKLEKKIKSMAEDMKKEIDEGVETLEMKLKDDYVSKINKAIEEVNLKHDVLNKIKSETAELKCVSDIRKVNKLQELKCQMEVIDIKEDISIPPEPRSNNSKHEIYMGDIEEYTPCASATVISLDIDLFDFSAPDPKGPKLRKKQCYRCGDRRHDASDCRHGHRVKCRNCGKYGHLERFCWSKK